MSYLNDEDVAVAFAAALPNLADAVDAFKAVWLAPLPPKNITASEFATAVFVNGPDPALLAESERLRACDHTKWQLSFMNAESFCLDVATYDDQASAEAALAAQKADQYGEGGGVLFKEGKVIGENLFLKHMKMSDYADYLIRATAAPPPILSEEQVKAANAATVTEQVRGRLKELTQLAPQIIALHDEYKARAEADGGRPQTVRGRPSAALVEFSQLFPQYITLGGCTGR
jgi:hypothetical protein